MQKHLLYINLFAIASALALGACADEVENAVTPEVPEVGEKTPIELSVGGVDSPETATRAVVTDGTTDTNFGIDTKVFILMKSDKEVDADGVVSHDGYEYKGDRASTLYTVSRGDVTHATDPNKIVFDNVNQKYWDDAHARSSQLTMWAVAQKVARSNVDGTWKNITFQQINGDKANPSISDSSDAGYKTTVRNEWQSTDVYPAIFSWSVGNLSNAHQNQDEYTIIYQDLLFSNNIADYTGDEWNTKIPEASRNDNRVKFNFSTHKFPASTELKFYHAMSKITIQIKAGEGFKIDGTDFNLANRTIDKLSGINTRGLFNIKDGEFQMIHDRAPITVIPCSDPNTGNNPYYTLEALAIPNIHEFLSSKHSSSDAGSRFVDGKTDLTSDVMLEFTIDNNKYQITSGQLYDALCVYQDGARTGDLVANATKKTDTTISKDYIPLEAGKNYVFTFTVGKSKIKNITAQVADWEEVTADNINPSNARIKLQLEERGEPQNLDVAFYKANDNKTSDGIDDDYSAWNWKTGYTNLNASYSSNHWTTNYFWESSKDFYHFRALMPAATGVTAESTDGDYVSLTSETTYTDVRWGAPLKDDGDNETAGTFKWTYDPVTYGFDNADHTQIYKAIGATEDPIKLILFHMMSDLTFKIKTTTGTDKVTLVDETDPEHPVLTKVQLEGFYAGGKVLLGSGLVKTTGSVTAKDRTAPEIARNSVDGDFQVYKYGVVPQLLTGVQLRITTPDKNEYIVDLANAKATTISTTNIVNPYKVVGGEGEDKNKYLINRWYPGFKYTYTFNLKKTGITDIQATIVEWEEVVADEEEVTIK